MPPVKNFTVHTIATFPQARWIHLFENVTLKWRACGLQKSFFLKAPWRHGFCTVPSTSFLSLQKFLYNSWDICILSLNTLSDHSLFHKGEIHPQTALACKAPIQQTKYLSICLTLSKWLAPMNSMGLFTCLKWSMGLSNLLRQQGGAKVIWRGPCSFFGRYFTLNWHRGTANI